MRRIISIALLGLLLYNMVGYSLVYLSEQTRTISAAGNSFVERARGSENILIKVPVSVPYQNDWAAPEPVQGQIEHHGRFYQMKSQQLINDTLYVQCEYDQNARDRFTELVSQINDQVTGQLPDSHDGQHSTILKNLLKEYMSSGRKHTFYVMEWVPARPAPVMATPLHAASLHFSMPSPPPDRA
ncbi:hypothetical protein [Dyadobacter sandarakinus]|uniref:Uncharacterized protein n=1 Tax=Dyadobacter sandarakinus TaxID=2747268 RepID=A0ABX7I8Z0_9BACT|nr:hypothetical protein [Dyadobacter sandarakinus]QRR02002.1 hypothetical protein HWI92_14335 [Dyadobacter sandarakinus]